MKRAAAIVLSLMFLWLQAMASAPTSFSFFPAKSDCACCDCAADGLLCHARTPPTPIAARDRRFAAAQNDLSVCLNYARGVDLARHRARPSFRFRFRAAPGAGRAALHAALRPTDLILPA